MIKIKKFVSDNDEKIKIIRRRFCGGKTFGSGDQVVDKCNPTRSARDVNKISFRYYVSHFLLCVIGLFTRKGRKRGTTRELNVVQ